MLPGCDFLIGFLGCCAVYGLIEKEIPGEKLESVEGHVRPASGQASSLVEGFVLARA